MNKTYEEMLNEAIINQAKHLIKHNKKREKLEKHMFELLKKKNCEHTWRYYNNEYPSDVKICSKCKMRKLNDN